MENADNEIGFEVLSKQSSASRTRVGEDYKIIDEMLRRKRPVMNNTKRILVLRNCQKAKIIKSMETVLSGRVCCKSLVHKL